MRVSELMNKPAITASGETSLAEIAGLMLDKGIGCVVIVGADGKIRGIITESDFAAKEKSFPFSTHSAPQVLGVWLTKENIKGIYRSAKATPAEDIMRRDVITISEDDSVERAVELMLEHDVYRLPVVREGRPVGIIARRDLLRILTNDFADSMIRGGNE